MTSAIAETAAPSSSVSTGPVPSQAARARVSIPTEADAVVETTPPDEPQVQEIVLEDGSIQKTTTTTIEVHGDAEDYLEQDIDFSLDGDGGPTTRSLTTIVVIRDGETREISSTTTYEQSSGEDSLRYTIGTENGHEIERVSTQTGNTGTNVEFVDGELAFQEYWEEHLGVTTEEDGWAVAGLTYNAFADEQLRERIVALGPNVDVRHSRISYGDGPVQDVYQVGDYSAPDHPGRTLTVTVAEDGVTYNDNLRTATSDGGLRIQDETVLVGSDYRKISDTTYRPDGTYVSHSEEWNGATLLSVSDASRNLISADQVSGPFADDFRAALQDGPIFHDNVQTQEFDPATGETHLSSVQTYLGEGGVQLVHVDGQGQSGSLFVQQGQILGDLDGHRLSVGQDGTVYVDGQAHLQLAATELATETGALNALVRGLTGDPLFKAPILPLLGTAIGALNTFGHLSRGELYEAAQTGTNTATPAAGVGSYLGGLLREGSKLQHGVKLFSRLLPAIPAVFNLFDGGRQLAEGDWVGGSTTIAQGIGLGLTLFGGPAGWVIFGAATLIKLGWNLWNDDSGRHADLTL